MPVVPTAPYSLATLLDAMSAHPELTMAAAAVATLFCLLLTVLVAKRRRRRAFSPAELEVMLRRVELLKALGEPEIQAAIQALETKTFKAGEVVFRQDEQGNDCFFVVAGEAVGTAQVHTFEVGTRVKHKKHGEGVVAEVTTDPSITKVVFDKGESHRYTPPSLHKLKPTAAVEPRVVVVRECRVGGHFGERALSRIEPRPLTVTCKTDVTVLRLTAETFLALKAQQDHKENLLRGVALFETFDDDQISQLSSVLELRHYADRQPIIVQGEEGHHFYILDAGEAVASIRNGNCDQEVKRYGPGELFGEIALLKSAVRAATVTAVGEGVRVWALSRVAFEKRLGGLSELKAEQYLADPRTLIANFYSKGDRKGPAGTRPRDAPPPPPPEQSSWFAVYRPCSRDSIAKMLGRVGTGKGLNIKGKSAKKNRLSGFVPFVQISKNSDKAKLETSPRAARTRIFYQSAEACATARAALESALAELQVERGKKLDMEVQEVMPVERYESQGAFGLDVPEGLMMEVYIMRADVSPVVGWETGRDSEPAFLDMNLHSLRDGGEPPVVLYQFDTADPMNPLGLLMAYAEARVTPVVSDFDTFLVGSRGVTYEPTPPEQIALMNWALDHTTHLLAHPTAKGWMSRWLEILKSEASRGFHPPLPKYGFGDPTSYGLIGSIVDAMSVCGAVRHGAECFNFCKGPAGSSEHARARAIERPSPRLRSSGVSPPHAPPWIAPTFPADPATPPSPLFTDFPQELDPDFLVVWDGLDSPPWKTVTEPELRAFLLERAREGFSFPLNPVWPIRDAGWLEVLHALQVQPAGERASVRACVRARVAPCCAMCSHIPRGTVSVLYQAPHPLVLSPPCCPPAPAVGPVGWSPPPSFEGSGQGRRGMHQPHRLVPARERRAGAHREDPCHLPRRVQGRDAAEAGLVLGEHGRLRDTRHCQHRLARGAAADAGALAAHPDGDEDACAGQERLLPAAARGAGAERGAADDPQV